MSGDRDYLPPFVAPDQCDHQGDGPCSRCCPCAECGAIRAGEQVTK